MVTERFDVLGLEPKSAGFSKNTDNLPPSAEEIVKLFCLVLIIERESF